MKLKSIPSNTVVHAPTEAEAKELLAILHENGYRWNRGNPLIRYTNWRGVNCSYHIYPDENVVTWNHSVANGAITLADFKERYCEQEKPQPKFMVGDKVRIIQDGSVNPDYVGIVDEIRCIAFHIYLKNTDSHWTETALEPYTEPETKPNEDMEINKELNLCKLLKGHEGETFYSLVIGECVLTEITPSDTFPIKLSHSHYTPDGKFELLGVTVVFPSRALYEQYPLDPYAAWMKWQEEQCRYKLDISYTTITDDIADCFTRNFGDIYFLTPADRDKCIEEIKVIIDKYSKK